MMDSKKVEEIRAMYMENNAEGHPAHGVMAIRSKFGISYKTLKKTTADLPKRDVVGGRRGPRWKQEQPKKPSGAAKLRARLAVTNAALVRANEKIGSLQTALARILEIDSAILQITFVGGEARVVRRTEDIYKVNKND